MHATARVAGRCGWHRLNVGCRVSDVRLFRSEDSDDEDEGIRKIGRRERGGRGSKDSTRGRKKGEVERVGRVKRPPPRRVRLDKSEVECRGRGRWEVTRSRCVWVRARVRLS